MVVVAAAAVVVVAVIAASVVEVDVISGSNAVLYLVFVLADDD